MKRAVFPICKTFKGYKYGHIQFPPLFNREELEICQFIREHKALIPYAPLSTGKTHLAMVQIDSSLYNLSNFSFKTFNLYRFLSLSALLFIPSARYFKAVSRWNPTR